MSNTFTETAEAVMEKEKNEKPTYMGEDGLLYCANCNTRVQTRIKIRGEESVVSCTCHCEQERIEREYEEFLFRLQSSEKRSNAFPDRNMSEMTFENDDNPESQVSKAVRAYVDNFDTFRKTGKGLLLWGAVGTGKTYMAACAVNALLDKNIPCLITGLSRMVNSLRDSRDDGQDYIDSLRRYSLLVIDDFGAERGSEYMLEQIFNIIDGRYRTGLPMIITTNLTIDQIKKPEDVFHERIYDRILECCHPIEIKGKSRRREKAGKDYLEIKKILGV